MSNTYTVPFPNAKGGFDDITIKANSTQEFQALFTEMNRKHNADIISGKIPYKPREEKPTVVDGKEDTTVDQRLKILESKVEVLTDLILKLVRK